MRLVLKPDELAPRKARARVSRLESRLGSRYDDVVLVISELVTNCVRHSSSDQSIEVTVDVSDTTIRVEVADRGSGFVATESMRGGGLGLIIVDRVAASWGVTTNGHCTVWAELPRAFEEVPETESGSASPRLRVKLPSG
jgi:anti-sigma regulatory factor (Ser/Thr protein kinase)